MRKQYWILQRGEQANVGFKSYDELIFNNKKLNDSLSPFTEELWTKTMEWYKVFSIIAGTLILIAVFILSFKIINVGINTAKKNEVKENLMRLCFGGVAIALAPFFIRFLLYINNSIVYLLITANTGTLDATLGNSMLTSIKTGNAISTALVISMFIYLFVKLNIKFIIRQFTIIIFTIFTPIACGLWIINKNVTAASIWAGQIIMNIFMQFIYCFLFLIYLAFLPSGGGWAISLIWAMMILPLADTLQNCLQNLTSRIAGVNNEQITNKVLGTSAMLGFGLGTIKEQFKIPKNSNKVYNNETNSNGLKGIISRAKSYINPMANSLGEKEYSGNLNPIQNIGNHEIENGQEPVMHAKEIKSKVGRGKEKTKVIVRNVANMGFKAARTYFNIGEKMVEGNFNLYKDKRQHIVNNVENLNNINKFKKGSENEHKRNGKR